MDKKRMLEHKINRLLEMFPVVAIVGPRQCGKSTLVKNIRSDWKYYDLERPDDFQLITSDPIGFFDRRSDKVIIDEAQQYPDLFQVLRGVIDEKREVSGRFLLTGSSSPEIVKGLSESLAGRIATVELWPFKAVELYEQPIPPIYHLLSEPNLAIEQLYEIKPSLSTEQVYDHWLKGGYPEPRIKESAFPEFYNLWMDAYFSDYIRRDIQRLFSRINTQTFRLFLQTLSFHSGSIINKSLISRALEVSSVTANSYLEIIHDTFIWRNLRSFENNPLKKIQKAPKGFFRDQGILHHLLKINELDQLLVHPAAGTSFESYVIEEIIRGFQCTLTSGIDYYYYRTKDKSEVDLIIDAPFGLIPVEVKLGHKFSKRMLQSLKNFIADTKSPFGILVNNSNKIEVLTEQIIQIPATCF